MMKCDSPGINLEHNNLEYNAWLRQGCKICLNWGPDYADDRMRFNRSKDFPKDAVLGGDLGEEPLRPLILTYSILQKTMSLTFRMVSTEKWSKMKAIAYLMDNCISEIFAKVIVEHATNYIYFYYRQKEIIRTSLPCIT